MKTIHYTLCMLASLLIAFHAEANTDADELSQQLKEMGPEAFFNTADPSVLVSGLRDSDATRETILPTLLSHCFADRSMPFAEGIVRLRHIVFEEALREDVSLFHHVADVGPNTLRLATVEWIARSPVTSTNATSRALAEQMIRHLATDTDPAVLIRTTRASLSMPPPFASSPALLANTLLRTADRVRILTADNRLTEARDILFRLRDVIDKSAFQAALGKDQYETLARNVTEALWPLTQKDVVYEAASWTLTTFNTPEVNRRFYLRATDETKQGRWSVYDRHAIYINRPLYLRDLVRRDCEAIMKQWTASFAERNGATNPPASSASIVYDRNDFILKLAASYGDYDLVEQAAHHENRWFHELAIRANNAFPKNKHNEKPNNGTEPIR